jgi:hypothetical protein
VYKCTVVEIAGRGAFWTPRGRRKEEDEARVRNVDSIRTFLVSFDGFYVDSDVSQSTVSPADIATSLQV